MALAILASAAESSTLYGIHSVLSKFLHSAEFNMSALYPKATRLFLLVLPHAEKQTQLWGQTL